MPHASGRTRAASGSPAAVSALPEPPRVAEPLEEPATNTANSAVPTSPVSTSVRDVERVRAEVRPAGDELVVDREVVQAEPEQRVRVRGCPG